MEFTRFAIVAAALACASVSTAAAADEILQFTLSGPDGNASWTQSSNPTPIFSDPVETVIDVTPDGASSNGLDSHGNTLGPITYYVPSFFGGLCTEQPCGYPNNPISEYGPTIFGGTTADPVFTVGTYDLISYVPGVGFEDIGETLVISAARVPEPASLALLSAGLAGFCALRRRRAVRKAG